MVELDRLAEQNQKEKHDNTIELEHLKTQLDEIRNNASGIRNGIEEQAWVAIDSLVETNKSKLAT